MYKQAGENLSLLFFPRERRHIGLKKLTSEIKFIKTALKHFKSQTIAQYPSQFIFDKKCKFTMYVYLVTSTLFFVIHAPIVTQILN